jgi:hypothetical protein
MSGAIDGWKPRFNESALVSDLEMLAARHGDPPAGHPVGTGTAPAHCSGRGKNSIEEPRGFHRRDDQANRRCALTLCGWNARQQNRSDIHLAVSDRRTKSGSAGREPHAPGKNGIFRDDFPAWDALIYGIAVQSSR